MNEYQIQRNEFARPLSVVDDGDGNVCIGQADAINPHPNPALLFLDILDIVKSQPLALRGSETRALAFLLATNGRGNLWFDGGYCA